MPSIDITTVAGVAGGPPATPSITRTTNIPDDESFTVCFWFKGLTFSDFSWPWWFEETGNTWLGGIETSTGGTQLLSVSGGSRGMHNNTSVWVFHAIVGSGSLTLKPYYMILGGAWNSPASITGFAATPNWWGFGSSLAFADESTGHWLMHAAKAWNSPLTEAELQAEATQISPIRTNNLTFFNSFTNHSNWNVDQSLTGGDFTLNGTAATSSDDPGIPFGPAFGILKPPPRPQIILGNNNRAMRGRLFGRGRSASFPTNLVNNFERSRPATGPSRPAVHSPQPLSDGVRQQFVWHTVFTRFGGKSLLLEGITRDCDGNPVGAMEVRIYRDSDGTLIGSTTSDGVTGAWVFDAPSGTTYQAVAWKAGTPNLAGVTNRGLSPV